MALQNRYPVEPFGNGYKVSPPNADCYASLC